MKLDIDGKKFDIEGKVIEKGECVESEDGGAELCNIDGNLKIKRGD